MDERARVGQLYPGRPVYLLGESIGAAVVMAAIASGAALETDGVILSAPAVWGGDQLNPFYRATLWLVNHPGAGWDLFRRTDPTLDDELNHLAWSATLPAARLRTMIDTYYAERGLDPQGRPLAQTTAGTEQTI